MEERAVSISVIIPAYNGERYLPETLASVMRQTLRNIEILCVDDGSVDGTEGIFNEAAKRDARVRVCTQANGGAGVARNLGIRTARGEYVAFLDADDVYPDDGVLALLYEKAKTHNAAICGGSFSCIYKGAVTAGNMSHEGGYTFPNEGMVAYGDYQFEYGYTRFIYRRSLLLDNGIFFAAYRYFEDPPFLVRAMLAAGCFYAVSNVVYRYRVGHKQTKWDAEKLSGLMDGLLDNLQLSRDNDLPMLHLNTLRRMESDWLEPLTQAALSGDAALSSRLHHLNAAVDSSLLRSVGEKEALPCLLTPLLRQMEQRRYSRLSGGQLQNAESDEVAPATQRTRALGFIIDPIKRGIVWLPCQIARAVRSLRDHGVGYMLSRLRYELGRWNRRKR